MIRFAVFSSLDVRRRFLSLKTQGTSHCRYDSLKLQRLCGNSLDFELKPRGTDQALRLIIPYADITQVF